MRTELDFKTQLENVLENNLDDDTLRISGICQRLGLSRMHLHRKVKRINDTSASIFIRDFRLEKGKYLLQKTDKKISQIAFEVGFKDPAYFCRCFKLRFNISPGQLRRLKKEKFSLTHGIP